MKHRITNMRVAVFSAITFVMASVLYGEDVKVPYGEELTISGNKTYGQIIVNGTLNIGEGADIKASRLMCGTNGSGTAVFNMGALSKLIITGKNADGLDCCFSYDTPCEATLARGAKIESTYVSLSYKGRGTSLVVMKDARFESDGTFYFCRNSADLLGDDRTRWTAQVRLTGENACLAVNRIVRNQCASARILFNGGYLTTVNDNTQVSLISSNQSYSNTKMMLEGENGNPVVIDARHRRVALFSTPNSENTKCGIQGNCDFIFRGLDDYSLGSVSNLGGQSFSYTGKTIIQKGGLKLNKANALPKTTDIEVCAEAELDIAGNSQTVSSIVSEGNVTDSIGSATLTLDGNVVDSVISEDGASCSIVKDGAANLTAYSGIGLSKIRINSGTVKVQCRRQVGYCFYRFVPTTRYGSEATGTQYNELHLFDLEGVDIVQKYKSYAVGVSESENPEAWKALDGNVFSKYYVPGSVNKAWISLEFETKQPVMKYSFTTGDDYGPIHKYAGRTDVTEPASYNPETCRDVSGFVFEGSDDGITWRTIHSLPSLVPEDRRNYTYPGWEWPRKVTLGSVYVEEGATLILDDVEATIGSLLCRGTFCRINDSEVVTGGENDNIISHPSFSGSLNLVKNGHGTTMILGDNFFSGRVDVREGTLRFADIGGVGPWFRFVITANRNNANNVIQISELALYDENRVRVNSGLVFKDINKDPTSLDHGEITAIYKAGSSEQPNKISDGDVNTKCGLYTATKPNALTMRLASQYASARVVAYALATGNDHAERDPAGWYLESSVNGMQWNRLDTRDIVSVGDARNSWSAYNDGIPYYATNIIPCSKAFDSAAVLSIAKGAVLDLVGSSTEIGALSVDYASAGEIKGGSIVAGGILDVTGLPLQWHQITLPLKFSGVSDCEQFSTWSVMCNGKMKAHGVYFKDGYLTVYKPGTRIIVR
ncbi:MAG: hypothetical protein IKK82_09590 [Kiritimatiellae bacterium]|nr:hypothetical protein [Kiritimatiellia bacterium]